MFKRENEFYLLILISLIFLLGIGIVSLTLDFKFPMTSLLFLLIIWIFHFYLKKNSPRSNRYLFPLISFLLSLSLINIYYLRNDLFLKQIFWIILGIIASMILMGFLKNYHLLEDYKYSLLILGIFLQIIVIIFGVEINQSKLWLDLKFFYFQPSEIVKILMVIFLADYLKENKDFFSLTLGNFKNTLKYLTPLLIMWGATLGILIFQKDLGMALLYFNVFLSLFFIATGRWDFLIFGILIFIFGFYFCYFNFFHIKLRLLAWLNPWLVSQGVGYQIIQAIFAVASGGLFGEGLAQGKSYYIPAVHTDFIFNSLVEQIGFLGGLIILAVYILIIVQGYKIALNCSSSFGKLLSFGLILILFWQSFIILGGNLKIIPLTGLTLPFLSYGGSSMLANFQILGILFLISNQNARES
ncbi:MAG: FtsW/RodA/SpoVE family cell cycle protein [Armatimonadetes bacterium]|nr:FtsW/RodA/SpoVE family cell cycle protein [Armatimonadota bacterium]